MGRGITITMVLNTPSMDDARTLLATFSTEGLLPLPVVFPPSLRTTGQLNLPDIPMDNKVSSK